MLKKDNKNKITEIIENVRNEFLVDNNLKDFLEINAGWCDRFANEVLYRLSSFDLTFYEIDTHHFMFLADDEEDYGIIEPTLIKREFNIDIPLEFSNISIGFHVWITDGDFHYDAECPEGVKNFFHLPFFQRYLNKRM